MGYVLRETYENGEAAVSDLRPSRGVESEKTSVVVEPWCSRDPGHVRPGGVRCVATRYF